MSKIETNPKFPRIEEKLLLFWQKNKIFEKSLEQTKDGEKFIFYDGPPFANGLPHYGHILAMSIKDLFTRYKTMRGYFVPRRNGWDCHGLPVEYEIEKELGISGKQEIEKYGVDKFIEKCRQSVFRYKDVWTLTMKRIGRWLDFNQTYATMDNSYIESVWWVFKKIWEKNYIYQSEQSLPYCPRCQTPLSNFEVSQNYKEISDNSIYLKFKIVDQDKYFLVWTTTPWTLPGNSALAVGRDIDYVEILADEEKIILAKDRLKIINGKYEIVKEYNGGDLVGWQYQPIYLPAGEAGPPSQKQIWRVFAADFVTTSEGTGIVHVAPAFGEDDLNLAKRENIEVLRTVDPAGKITAELPWKGESIFEANPKIIEDLQKKNILYKQEKITHSYPFCWRCDSPLIYYAIGSWFVAVSKIVDKLVFNNQKIHWQPEYLKQGRFGKWLAGARDWAISRNRYWGAPIPVWKCDRCSRQKVISDHTELDVDKNFDLHRPNIDSIEFDCSCGGKMKRVKEVLDCWFESGSMPYGQWHYPVENKREFKANFPADFIAEGMDQTRGWFYTMHVISTIIFDSNSYKNVVANGMVLGPDGKKLSKRLKNYIEPDVIFNSVGVDSLRQFLYSSVPIGANYLFSEDKVKEELRKVILPLWNVYVYYKMYLGENNQEPNRTETFLDRWILSRLDQLILTMTENLDKYQLTKAARSYEDFIVDLSTWYLRRSRKRQDKNFAVTLKKTLLTLVKLIAPFMPFVAEEIYQGLKQEQDPISVHLCNWPKSENLSLSELKINQIIINQMAKAQEVSTLVLGLRAEAKIKVRQPLATVLINQKFTPEIIEILKDELNVKEITYSQKKKNRDFSEAKSGNLWLGLDLKITPKLRQEGTTRSLARLIQGLRKQANLVPQNKINLFVDGDPELISIIKNNQQQLGDKTSSNINFSRQKAEHELESEVEGKKIWFGISKL